MIFMFLLGVFCILYCQSFWTHGLKTIDGDGSDYYSYLLSVFINQDLGHQNTSEWYVINTPGGTINLHTVGLSILWLPFFAIGAIWAKLGGYQMNGLSYPFSQMIQIAAFTFGMTGVWFIQKITGLITQNIFIRAFVPLSIVFGTNALFYMVNSPSMSHIYSFTLIAIFVYLCHQVFAAGKNGLLPVLGVVLALIILVRPFNGLVVLLMPMWNNSFREFFEKCRFSIKNKRRLLFSIALFITLLSIQSLIWFMQNGKIIQDSYKGNGFYFSDPHTLQFLFGFTSGLFIYTPLCFIALLFGLYIIYRNRKPMFVCTFLFLALTVYVLSSYWAYNFSDSLGMRVMVDYYVLFAIALTFALAYIKKNYIRFALVALVAVTGSMSLLFHYQMVNGIISPAYMTYEKFRFAFLKTDKSYANKFGGCNDLPPYLEKRPTEPVITFSSPDPVRYSSSLEFGQTFQLDTLKMTTNKLYVEVEIERTENKINASSEAMFSCTVKDSAQKDKFWYAFRLNETPSETDNKTRTYNYSLVIDKKLVPNDNMAFFIWNIKRQDFTVNKLNIKIYNYNFET